MKIQNSPQLPTLVQESRAKAKQAESAPKGAESFVTDLNLSAHSDANDINLAKVNEIRLALSEGRLNIDPNRIARELLDSVREMVE